MTAAIAGAAAESAGAAAGAGEATAVSRVAPSASGPVGTARAGAGAPGATARTKAHFAQQPKTMPTGGGGGGRPPAAAKPAGKGGGVTTGKTTTTRSGKTTTTSSSKRSAFPAFFGGGKGKGGWVGSGSGQRLLVAEFVICSLILALSPLTDRHKVDTPAVWMKRATAICALFIVLGLVGTGGPKSAKVAASFGGLVTLVLLLTDRDVLVVIADRMGAPPGAGPRGPGSDDGTAGPTGGGGTGTGSAPPPDDGGIGIAMPPPPPGSTPWWDWLRRALGPI